MEGARDTEQACSPADSLQQPPGSKGTEFGMPERPPSFFQPSFSRCAFTASKSDRAARVRSRRLLSFFSVAAPAVRKARAQPFHATECSPADVAPCSNHGCSARTKAHADSAAPERTVARYHAYGAKRQSSSALSPRAEKCRAQREAAAVASAKRGRERQRGGVPQPAEAKRALRWQTCAACCRSPAANGCAEEAQRIVQNASQAARTRGREPQAARTKPPQERVYAPQPVTARQRCGSATRRKIQHR
jgi:hypothetical protein